MTDTRYPLFNDGRPFSPAQLAERWDVSKRTVLRICKAGKIRSFLVGRDYRITPEAVLEFEGQDQATDRD